MFPDMPFGNMDSDKIEARKGLLETFLKVGGSAPPRGFSHAPLTFHLASVACFSNSAPCLKSPTARRCRSSWRSTRTPGSPS